MKLISLSIKLSFILFLSNSALAQLGTIEALQLWDENSRQVAGGYSNIQNGDTVDIARLDRAPLNFAVRLNRAKVGSVQFRVNTLPVRVENSAPYTAFQEQVSQVNVGTYSIVATVYEKGSARGRSSAQYRWSFTVIDSRTQNPDPEPEPEEPQPEPEPGEYVYPGEDWVSVTPESQNVDSAKLRQAMQTLARYMEAESTLVIRGGYAIWKGRNYKVPSGMASSTKTVTSTMLGVLVTKGIVKTTDPVSLTYPDGPNHLWKHYAAMTVNGKYSYNTYMNEYAKMLTYVADEDLYHLFMRHIGNPIGMNDDFIWRPGNKTNYIRGHIIREGAGVSGVTSSASDWARLCYLYLRGGRWNGQQILDAQYVAEATVNQSIGTGWGAGRYGYNFWTNTKNTLPDASPKAYWSWGRGGRTCVVLPEWDMVVVRVGKGVNEGWNLPNEFFRDLRASITDLK